VSKGVFSYDSKRLSSISFSRFDGFIDFPNSNSCFALFFGLSFDYLFVFILSALLYHLFSFALFSK